MILDAKDLMLCKLTEMAYCPIHKPIYNSASNANCLISLFNKNIELIKEHCQPVYRKMPQVPVITKLKTGSWISSSKSAYDVSIICPQETTRQYTVFPGVELINLNQGCSGYYSITSYTHVSSTVHAKILDSHIP